jgi:NOL1/NOP2/fmu family ribosome biogenesis protein
MREWSMRILHAASYTPLSDAESSEVLCAFARYYGLPAEVFSGHRVARKGRKALVLVAESVIRERRDDVEAMGVSLMALDRERPKISTQAALIVGRQATRNVVDLPWTCHAEVFSRGVIETREEWLRSCEVGAFVIMRLAGIPVGTGYLWDEGKRLKSLLPKKRLGVGSPSREPATE